MTRHVLTILAVADVGRASAFYRTAFPEWSVAVEVPVYTEFRLPDGHRLGVYQREAFARNTGAMPQPWSQGTTGTEIYLACEDLPALEARLVQGGARLLSPLAPRSWGEEVAYYADLDGNVLALAPC